MIAALPPSPVRGPSPEPDLGPYYHIPATVSYTGPNGFVTRPLCYSSMEADDSLPAPTEPPLPASPRLPSPPPLENDEWLPGVLRSLDDPPRDRPPSPESCKQAHIRCRGVDGLGCHGMHDCVDAGEENAGVEGDQAGNNRDGGGAYQYPDNYEDIEDEVDREEHNDDTRPDNTAYVLRPRTVPSMGPSGSVSNPLVLRPIESFGGDDSPAPTHPPPPRRPWSPPSVVGYWPRGWVRYPDGPPSDPPETPGPAHNAHASDVESLSGRGEDGYCYTEEDDDSDEDQGEDEVDLGNIDQDGHEDGYEDVYEAGYEDEYEDGYEDGYEDAEDQYDDDY